uniref:Uncharacterized protein n=1 Tax=Aegilops tauschii subsp. strangulata TaxID=200361 RepID=A0A453D660_AEGTS
MEQSIGRNSPASFCSLSATLQSNRISGSVATPWQKQIAKKEQSFDLAIFSRDVHQHMKRQAYTEGIISLQGKSETGTEQSARRSRVHLHFKARNCIQDLLGRIPFFSLLLPL